MEGTATAAWRVYARAMEGTRVERKGREKAVACRRVERTAIVCIVVESEGRIKVVRSAWGCLLYVHVRHRDYDTRFRTNTNPTLGINGDNACAT